MKVQEFFFSKSCLNPVLLLLTFLYVYDPTNATYQHLPSQYLLSCVNFLYFSFIGTQRCGANIQHTFKKTNWGT